MCLKQLNYASVSVTPIKLDTQTYTHEVITTVPVPLSLPFTRRVTAAIDNLEPSGQKSQRLSPKQDFRSHRALARPPLPNLECGRRSAKLRRAIWPPFRGPPSLARIIRKEGRNRVSLRVHIGSIVNLHRTLHDEIIMIQFK